MASGGQIGISVFPNLLQFQNKIRTEVRKANENHKVDIPVDVKVDRVELDKLEEDLDRLDNRSIHIKADVDLDSKELDAFMGRRLEQEIMVGVNTGPARRAIEVLQEDVSKTPLDISAVIKIDDKAVEEAERDLRNKELRVEGHLDLSTLQADLEMIAFKSRHSVMTTHLLVERVNADREMDDFRAKQALSPVRQRIIYETSSVPEAPKAKMPNMNLPSSPWKGVEKEGWNVINMWGKMWTAMHGQIDAGIIDIYDDYRKFGVWLGKTLAKPVQNFHNMWRSSSTAGEFSANMSGSFKKLEDRMTTFGLNAASKMEDANIKMTKAWEGFSSRASKSLGRLGASLTKVRDRMVDFGSSVGRSVSDAASTAAQKVAAPFQKMGRFFRVEIGGAISSWGNVFRKMGGDIKWLTSLQFLDPFNVIPSEKIGMAFKAMADNIGLNMRVVRLNISDGFKKAFDPVLRPIRRLSDGIGRSARDMGDRFKVAGAQISTAMEGARRRVQGLAEPLGRAGDSIKRWSSTMSRGITTAAQRVGASGSKVFSAVGSRLGNLMARSAADPKAWAIVQKLFGTIGKYTRGFSRIAIGAFAKVTSAILGSLVPALKAAGVGILLLAGQAAIGAIITLGSAIASAAQGALLLAPALVAAAGVSFAVLKVGLKDVGEAVGNAFSVDTLEEFEESISGMPASVREVARAFRTIKPAVDEMKTAVQDNLLEGLRPGIENALSNLFPAISSGMQGLAAEWNHALKAALDELGSDRAGAGMENIMQNIVRMGNEMRPVIANLLTAFGSLADQGSNWLPQLGKWLSDITNSFAEWAEGLRAINEETGKSEFDTKMQNAVDSAKALGSILGGVFGTLRNIFSAAGESGTGMLDGMVAGAQAMNEATKKGTENYEKMVGFFTDANRAASMLGEILSPVFGIVADIASSLMRLAEGIIPGLAVGLEGLGQSFEPIKEAARGIGEDIGNGIGALAPALAELGNVVAPLLEGLASGLGGLLESIGPALERIVSAAAPVAEAFTSVFEVAGGSLGEIFIALEPVITSGLNILEKMAPVLENIFGWFGVLGSAIVEALAPLFVGHDESMGRLLEAITPVVDALGNGLLRVIELLAPYIPLIAEAFDLIVLAIASLLPLLPPVIDFVLDIVLPLADMLLPLAAIIGGIFLAVKIGAGIIGVLSAAMEVARGVFMLARGAVMLFNLALAANPIMLIVAAIGILIGALVYFFTQTETGKAMWQSFTDFLGNAWNMLMEGIQWAWEHILKPVWDAISLAARVLFAVVMTVLITPFILAWNTLVWAINGLWNNVLKPTWDALSAGISHMWTEWIQPILNWIGDEWNKMVFRIQAGWFMIQQYWNLMQMALQFLWQKYVQPILDWIGNKWNEMKDWIKSGWDAIRDTVITPFQNGIRALYDEHIRPKLDAIQEKWDSLKNRLQEAWRNIKETVIDAFQNRMQQFKDDFGKTVDNIGKMWNGLKSLMQKPINWAIHHVFNEGIRKAWNAVANLVNLGTLEPAKLVGDGSGYASGGVLPGYSPGYDDHHFYSPTAGRLHLSGGEAIMRPEWTKAVGGPKAVAQMNNAARKGSFMKKKDEDQRAIKASHGHSQGGVLDLGGFAYGGTIDAMVNIVKQKYPGLTLTSHYRPGGPYHGTHQATDWSNGSGNTPMQLALAHDIAQTYPGSAQLIYDSPGWSGNIYEGGPAGAMDSGIYKTAQAGRHDHHVHWAMTKNPTLPFGGGVFEGGSGGGGGGFWQAITNTVKGLWDKVIDIIPKFPGAETMGEFGKIPGAWLKKQAAAAWDFIKSKADQIFELVGGGGSSGSVDIDGITGPVVDQVEQVFARHGFTGAEWDAAKWIIQKESNWSPTATNPSSGAFGLFQFNPMGGDTLGTYLPSRSTDPAVQADAGARYIKDRYGTPTAAKSFWEANNWYDRGGLARGRGILQKEVVTPERVLSPQQTKAFESFVFGFMPELIRSYKNRPFELWRAVDEIIDGWNGIQTNANKDRRRQIEGLAGNLKTTFQDQADGGRRTGRELDMASIMQRFEGRQGVAVTADSLLSDARFLESWAQANGAMLKGNIEQAARDSVSIGADPHAYLEAERIAKDRIDEEEEKKKEESDKKRDEERQKRDEEARKKRDEERNAILEGLSEDQKELKKAEFDREDEARDEAKRIEDERQRELERAEQERIDEMKASGEYYYGYKTLGDDGTNPNEYEDSEQVKEFKRYTEAGADFAGVSDAYNGVMTRMEVLLSLGSGIKTATPAWIAAANGDRSGLNHNIAAAHAANQDRTMEEARNLGPSALFGVLEMVSSATADKGPFIGTVQSGMTPGQLNSTLTHYETQRARRRGGTSRTR